MFRIVVHFGDCPVPAPRSSDPATAVYNAAHCLNLVNATGYDVEQNVPGIGWVLANHEPEFTDEVCAPLLTIPTAFCDRATNRRKAPGRVWHGVAG